MYMCVCMLMCAHYKCMHGYERYVDLKYAIQIIKIFKYIGLYQSPYKLKAEGIVVSFDLYCSILILLIWYMIRIIIHKLNLPPNNIIIHSIVVDTTGLKKLNTKMFIIIQRQLRF